MAKGKVIFGTLIALVVAGGGYWFYRSARRRKAKQADMAGIRGATVTTSTTTGGTVTTTVTGSRNDYFPLAKGSRGDLVKRLQDALMILYPNSLPKFGADGEWGAETEAALKKNNQPTVINKADFDRIVAASKTYKPLPTASNDRGVAGWF